jgi:hypothetical protein
VFYGRFKIRVFCDTLRSFADGRIVGANEETPAAARPTMTDLPELDLLYRAVFVSPDTFINLNPLNEEGRSYWTDLGAAYERGKFTKARELASAFADWLEKKYQKKERLQFDDSTFSVVLDGELYSRLRPDGYAVLKLLQARGGHYLTAAGMIVAIRDEAALGSPVFAAFHAFPDGAAGLKRISRAIAYLPPDLRKIIQSQQGLGRRLCLPPQ